MINNKTNNKSIFNSIIFEKLINNNVDLSKSLKISDKIVKRLENLKFEVLSVNVSYDDSSLIVFYKSKNPLNKVWIFEIKI